MGLHTGLLQVRFLAVLLLEAVVVHVRPELHLENGSSSAGGPLQQADSTAAGIPTTPSALVTDTRGGALLVTDLVDRHLEANIPAFPVPNSLDAAPRPAPTGTSPPWPTTHLHATPTQPLSEWGSAPVNAVAVHLPVVPVAAADKPGHQAHQAQGGHRHPPCQPGLQRPGRCEVSVRSIGDGNRVVCSGGLHKISRTRSHKKTTALVLCYWPEDTFDPSMLTMFERLERLRLSDSNITEVLDFPYHEHLQELVLSGLGLTWVGDDIFMGLRRLRVLDLSRNLLSSLDRTCVLRLPSLQQLLLAGNPWRCTLRLSWLAEPAARRLVADADGMQCGAALWPRRPVLPVLTLLKRVSDECPASNPCSCELTGVVRDAREAPRGAPRDPGGGGGGGGELLPIITVNCSHRSLGAIPGRLPANTTTLLLRGNKITSVRPLVDLHASVLDVYLDDNQVESIADLEGSPWLANFRVLSLRANKLEQLPTYALDNALERNDHVVRVYLGLNPWRCDCQFTPTFQELLAKYKPLIQDWDDIRCAAVEGDDNSMKKIHALSRRAVCREEGEPRVSALDLLNAALGVSLVAVLAKLAFDFWRYRRYGRLPWIATKLP